MRLSVTHRDDVTVVAISGTIAHDETGDLLDSLVTLVGRGGGGIVLDLASLTRISRAAMRGIVVAAKMLDADGRAMRICHARDTVASALAALGYAHLLHLDATLGDSLAALALEPNVRPGVVPRDTPAQGATARRGRVGGTLPLPVAANGEPSTRAA